MTAHPREGGRKHPFAPVDRRTFLTRSGLAVASLPLASAILAACGTGNPQSSGEQVAPARPSSPVTLPDNPELEIASGLKPEEGPLEIYNWEEYVNPRVIGMFEEKYGVKVNVNTFNTMSEAVANLTTNKNAKYDVWIADVDQLGKFAASGLLRPLNKSYIANLANVWSRYNGTEANQPYYDLGAKYSVPYTTYTSGIGWRIDKPEGSTLAGPGEGEVDSWEMLWNEQWKGKIHILDDVREAIAMALLRNGITDINTDDAATRAKNLQLAEDSLVELVQKVDVKADISDYTDLPEGQSLIHHGWSGDFMGARWYFPSGVSDKDVIRYWSPEAEGPGGNDTFTVLAAGENPVLAHLFLDFILDFEMAMINFQFNAYIPPMTDMDPEKMLVGGGESYSIVMPGLASAIATEKQLNKQTELAPLSPEVNSQWQDVWEVFQSQG